MVGFVPRELFFTKGVGTHREKLTSFDTSFEDDISAYGLSEDMKGKPEQRRVFKKNNKFAVR